MEKIDCKSFVELIQLIVDDEATDEQKALFKKHFAKCSHCANHYNIEASTMEFIKKKVCACQISAPSDLAEKIRQKIASIAS